jgi:uncharacterized RDD family membrane protein YckC
VEREQAFQSPEGVALRLELADGGSRAAAFVVDYTIATTLTVVVLLLAAVASAEPVGRSERDEGGFAVGFGLIAAFLIQNFYFIASELWFGGRTLGKRWLGLRVVARDGGELDAGRIYARNLMRDLELFVPLAFVIQPTLLLGDSPVAARLLCLVWVGLVACFPLFNAERSRIGDLVAGTMVVAVPKLRLLPDLAASASESARGSKNDIVFSDAQLDVYGERELHVLEGVLRRAELSAQSDLLTSIADKIRRKIKWKGRSDGDPQRFLRAFYAAQRRRLEQRMLLGQRRARKRGG